MVAYSRVSCFQVSIRLERIGRGDADTFVGCSGCHDLKSRIARRRVDFWLFWISDTVCNERRMIWNLCKLKILGRWRNNMRSKLPVSNKRNE